MSYYSAYARRVVVDFTEAIVKQLLVAVGYTTCFGILQYRWGTWSGDNFRVNTLQAFVPYIWLGLGFLTYHIVHAAHLLNRSPWVDEERKIYVPGFLPKANIGHQKLITHLVAGALCVALLGCAFLLFWIAPPFPNNKRVSSLPESISQQPKTPIQPLPSPHPSVRSHPKQTDAPVPTYSPTPSPSPTMPGDFTSQIIDGCPSSPDQLLTSLDNEHEEWTQNESISVGSQSTYSSDVFLEISTNISGLKAVGQVYDDQQKAWGNEYDLGWETLPLITIGGEPRKRILVLASPCKGGFIPSGSLTVQVNGFIFWQSFNDGWAVQNHFLLWKSDRPESNGDSGEAQVAPKTAFIRVRIVSGTKSIFDETYRLERDFMGMASKLTKEEK